ncbi:MAG: hypothetical protein CMH83_19405 [Nocardioides sp.]|nr:hypothetical protein [Nocardioides sp.]
MSREPEWDDAQRDALLGLQIYESQLCRCGVHSTLTHDPEQRFPLDSDTCPVCAGLARYDRILRDGDEQHLQRMGSTPPPGMPRPSDGRHVYVHHEPPADRPVPPVQLQT